MFSDFEFDSQDSSEYSHNQQQTPSVIGANEVYLDPRMKMQAQKQQNKLQVEGEKLSFKDKMKLFAKEAGENTPDGDHKLKVSKKQREIESKMN